MIPVGENAELENLYSQLSELDEKEIFALECGARDKLESIRKEMLPIKQRINELEGEEIYPV